jgi:hypothetical protein
MIRIDMGASYTISKVSIYADPNYYASDDGAPCSVGSIKVCDDSACSGETSLIGAKCSFGGTVADWYNCTFAATTGRYVEVKGGMYDPDTSACVDKDTAASDEMTSLYEMKFCEG